MNENKQSFGSRLKHAWNVFRARDETSEWTQTKDIWAYSNYNPTRPRFTMGNERSIISSIYNRIAMDVAAFDIQHVRLDANGRYTETLMTGLNNCLSIEANKDQTGRTFITDIVMSMFDEGTVAIIPVDTSISPKVSGSYEINSLRTGKILEWYPDMVRVELYDDTRGIKDRVIMPKSAVGIIENPLYSVMNEPNSTLKRLIRKLNLLDAIDEQSGSGKLDIIIQLPYLVKTEARQQQAMERKKALEDQLYNSRYGIGYIDGTEKITQLNRPSENNLLAQITYLQGLLYSQLGITQAVFDGTGDERAMLNYYNRTIEPIVTAIVEEFRRKFLTKTARSQGQTIMGFRDSLKLVPANEMAEIADSFTRNEILTSNEVRAILGMKPAMVPQADELRNKNMPIEDQTASEGSDVTATNQNGSNSSATGDEYDKLVEETLAGIEADMMSIIDADAEEDEEGEGE